VPKDITKHAEELRRTSRLVSDAAKKYLAYSGERDRSFRPIVTAAHEMVLRG